MSLSIQDTEGLQVSQFWPLQLGAGVAEVEAGEVHVNNRGPGLAERMAELSAVLGA